MKKLLVLAMGVLLLSGCGGGDKAVTCKMDLNGMSAAAELKYDSDKKITGMKLTSELTIPDTIMEDKSKLKEFKENLNASNKKFKTEGVSSTTELNEKTKKASLVITVKKEAITKDAAKEVGFYYTKDVKKAVKEYKETGFTCGDVK